MVLDAGLLLAERLGVGARAAIAGIGVAPRGRIFERAGRRGTIVAGRERQIPVQEVIAVATGDDRIFGGNGDDFVVGMRGVDEIHGDNGNDIVIGGPANDVLFGDNGDDFIFGTFGNDSLAGGNGDDFLSGDLPFPFDGDGSTPPGVFEDPNPNTDTCEGGAGADAEAFCESYTSIESHPDPDEVVLPD